MSLFAKIFIIINSVLSIVLTLLLATLLTQKADYKTMHFDANKTWQATQLELERNTQDWEAQLNSLQGQLDVKEKKRKITETTLASFKDKVKELDAQLQVIDGEVAQLDSRKSGQSKKIGDLDTEKKSLISQIDTAKQEREQAIKESKTANEERTKLETEHLDLKRKQRDEEKAGVKLGDRVTELDDLWTLIVFRHPQVLTDIPAPDLKGTVKSVSAGSQLVTISIGRDSGVRVGYKFTVFRGSSFIGVVYIDNVSKEQASARIDPQMQNGKIQVGDSVQTNIK